MEQRLTALESQLQNLTRELSALKERLDRLEARVSNAQVSAPAPGDSPSAAALPAAGAIGATALPDGVVALVGRTLIVLGGAYLLRAVTDAGVIPALGGAVAGLAYAGWWLLLSDRAAAKGRGPSAAFHALAAAMIAYPLLWETTVRHRHFEPGPAALVLLLCFGAALAVAWRRARAEIAWTHALSALATASALLVGTHALMTFTLALLLMAGVVEALAFRGRWLGLRWPAALALDLAFLAILMVALRPEGPPEGHAPLDRGAVLSVGLALAVLYLGSIAARTLVGRQPASPFELVQAAGALLVGFGGAVRVVTFAGGSPAPLGLMGLALGAGAYAVAFAFIERRSGQSRNFYAYTTFGGVLTLVSSALLLGGGALVVAWSALAVTAAAIGCRYDRTTLSWHAVVYLTSAAVVSDLLGACRDGLLARPLDGWRPLGPVPLAVFLVIAVTYAVLALRPGLAGFHRLPRAAVAALLVWCAGGLGATALAAALAGAPGPQSDAALVAAGRTAVLSALAVTAAWVGRRRSLPELTWLVYPLLAGGGFKILTEDLSGGRPLTLFLSFAFYGGALIATPRLMRSPVRS